MSSEMAVPKKRRNSSKRGQASARAGAAASPRLDRTSVRIVNSFEEADQIDREYWARQTPRAASRTGTIAPTQLRLWRQQTYTTISESF